ncbi:ASKHA domain-containing protein [Blautia faecis]|uniref:ASKHA domain-containing protein n=1 Tax=Blautia faecis TaxID=871665 RepID=UPI001D013704|nr:ASKHA domain-containing protein [Blautia faecis]MCB5432573.1 ASKHA domain-containing protein [Blautia faecis]
MMNGLSQKQYLELPLPTEDDPRSDQQRILDSLMAAGVEERVHIPVHILRELYPLLDNAKWKITVSLAWNGENWEMVEIEEGDTTAQHYGLAVDLGSTTVVARLLDCNSGEILKEVSCFNKQIQWGTDILSRIFYCKDNKEKLEEVRRATVESICECMDKLDASLELQGTPSEQKAENNGVSESGDDRGAKNAAKKARTISHSALSMVIAGNTTMIHFLLGMDAFCVFYTPHAVHADCPGFQLARDLDIPLKGYVYCYPAKSNYLGGDIISGMIDTELYKKNEISVFFDIGTNGELVIGNKEFLLCGAGAAGPALEGGVVRTGMRADIGAVDEVKIRDGNIYVHVIGSHKEDSGSHEKNSGNHEENSSGEEPRGICGSGIIDLIAELFLEGWIDIRGKLSPEKSPLIQESDNQLCVEYAPGLYFYQKDIDEFIRTKSAAHTMVEIMLRESGLELNQADRFYVAGAFGKHVSKESAITIGMYPDMDRDHIINAGNSSLEGAQKLLLNWSLLTDIDQILEEMVYIQFAEVEDFLELMVAAQALPHTDYKRYPTVMEKLKERQKDIKL